MDTCLCIAFEEHYLKLAYRWVFFLISVLVLPSRWQYVLTAENICLKKYIFYHPLPTIVDAVDESMAAPVDSSF